MNAVDEVARSIFLEDMASEVSYKRDWNALADVDQDGYRRMAQAAIDTLGITLEEECTPNGLISTTTWTRLVSRWRAKENDR